MDSGQQISISTQREIDLLCDEVETGWRIGEEPDLKRLIDECESGAAQMMLLTELIKLDLEINGKSFIELQASYEDSLPEHILLIEQCLEAIWAEGESDCFSDLMFNPAKREFPPESFIGRTIGDYQIEELVSVGGFGIVYKANDWMLDRTVIIKIPRHIRYDSTNEIDAFLDEARKIANLDHRNILGVYHVGVDAGLPFIVEEYVTEGDLKQLLLDQIPDTTRTVELVRSIVSGVGCAHKDGIIHRDLKPSNILVNAEGEPVIADFGLAISEQSGRPGQIAGTIRYMSPEQIRGESDLLDARSDIWAIGILLYEMLVGPLPSHDLKPGELSSQTFLSQRDTDLDLDAIEDDELRRICSRCLKTDIADRYQSAAELETDLAAFQQRESELKFHRAAEQNPGLVIRYVRAANGKDEITYVSDGIRELYEFEPEEAMDDASLIWTRVHKDDLGMVSETVSQSFQTLEPIDIEHRMVLPKRGLRWAHVRGQLTRAEDGSVVWDGFIFDHTERKLAEIALLQDDVIGTIEPEHVQHTDRFHIPQKLYGRGAIVSQILDTFERVAGGSLEMVLVSGTSGVGKTAVVNELQNPITEKHGYFVQGKFDQYRNFPFSAFLQCFRNLMGQLFSESEVRLKWWKARILSAIGDNGQVLIDVIPELESIIGSQPPVATLEGSAGQNRFNLVFEKFIAVFATKDHPLVMFLDDLQWADQESLGILEVLMGEHRSGHLMLLGAFRSNEVSLTHPLMLALDDLNNQQTSISTIALKPLAEEDINQLIAETLNCTPDSAMPLSALVYQQTMGNPFFATQFLKGLNEDGLITFDRGQENWECDLVRVREAALTDDFVEYMIGRLHRLPKETQNVLELAACIGSQFDINMLATVSGSRIEKVASDLWSAIREGLVLPQTQAYRFSRSVDDDRVDSPAPLPPEGRTTNEELEVGFRFLHDGVQQAAYSLMPEAERQLTHYRLGRQLVESLSEEEQEKRLFEIVGQLNMGHSIAAGPEIQQMVLLNRRAGIKAKSATAYRSALQYFTLAMNGHASDNWRDDYALTLSLHDHTTEVAYLTGNFDRMEQLVQEVTTHATNRIDTATVLGVRMQYLLGQNQPQAALDIGLELLKELGVDVPASPSFDDVKMELASFRRFAADFGPAEIADLPHANNPKDLAIFGTIQNLLSTSIIVDPNLFHLLTLTFTRLTLERGLSTYSPHGFCGYAVQLINLQSDIQGAFEWGQLALSMANSSPTNAVTSIVYENIGAFLHHGKCHLRETLPFLNDAREVGFQHGDFQYPGYAMFVECQNLFHLGRDLPEVNRRIVKANSVLDSIGQNLSLSWNACFEQAVNRLQELPNQSLSSTGEVFAYEAYVETKRQQGDSFGMFFAHFNEAIHSFLFGETEQALVASDQARECIAGPTGLYSETVFYFYDSLIRLSNAKLAAESESADIIAANQARMKLRAEHAPMNYQHKFDLVEAERCRAQNLTLEAMELYDLAINGAKEHDYLQEEALANELAGRFYLDSGRKKIAAAYLREAHSCYKRWGAKAKAKDLTSRYVEVLEPALRQSRLELLDTLQKGASFEPAISLESNRSGKAALDGSPLDLPTVLQSARALSESTDLGELLKKLSTMMLRTSGAEQLALFLPDADEAWNVRVTATPDSTQVVSKPLADHTELPCQLVDYVIRTREVVAANHLQRKLPVVDPWLQQNRRASVLCLPLMHQAKLVGVLYLDHGTLDDAFSRDRVTVLNFLCAQAAISLENALLTQALEQKLEIQTSKRKLTESRLEQLPVFTYKLKVEPDGNVTILDVSDKCIEYYGVPPESFTSGQHTFRDFEHEADRESVDQWLEELRGNLELTGLHEFRIVSLSGKVKWIRVTTHSVSQDTNGCNVWDGVVFDITEKKMTEFALGESEARYRGLVEQAADVIWASDVKGKITYRSPQYQSMFNLDPNDWTGEKQWETIHPDDREKVKRAADQLWSEGKSASLEYRHLCGDGSYKWVMVSANAVFDDQGQQISHQGIISDISDLKKTEQALLLSEQKYSTLLDALPIGVCHSSADGSNCLYVNKGWSRITQRQPDEALGINWRDFIYPDDLPAFDEAIKTFIEDEHQIVGQPHAYRQTRPDGSIRWMQIKVVKQINEDGELIGNIATISDITELREADLALRASEVRTRKFLESLPVGTAIASPDGVNITKVNNRWCEMTQRPPEATLGQEWMKIIHPDDLPSTIEGISEFLSDPDLSISKPCFFRIPMLDESFSWFQGVGVREFDAQGEVTAIIWSLNDITALKQAELDLNTSDRKFASVAATAPVGIFQTDTEHNCVYVNDRMAEFTGRSREQMLGKGYMESIHPDDRQRLMAHAEAFSKDKTRTVNNPFEVRHLLPDGRITWVLGHVAKEFDDNGNPIGFVGTLTDITNAKVAEERQQRLNDRLQESESKFKLLVEQVADLIWSADIELKFTYLSPKFQSLFGLDPDDWIGKTCFELVHPDDLEIMIAKGESLREDPKTPISLEFRHLCKNGSYIWVRGSAIAIMDAEGNVVSHQGVLSDIPERKAVEIALQDAQSQMQLMTENVPGMIYRGVMRADGSQHMLYISPKVRELFEVEPEEALADFSKLSSRWHPDDIHLIKDCISNLCEKPDRFQAFEYRVILPKQGLRWRQAFGQASATEGGDTIFDVIVIDITDRKNTEIALQDAQSRIKGMAENIPGMVYQYLLRADGSHALTYVSSKCREMFEVEPEDALANADLLFGRRLPEDLEKVQEAIRVSAETLQPYQEETRFLLPKQGLCWRQINSEPRRLENGDTIWDGVVLDINDRKQTELALQEERAKFLQITDGNAS